MATNTALPAKLERLEAFVAQASGIDRDTLHSTLRDREYADARHAIWYIARKYLGYSFPELGRLYGRDHTTVIHGVERMAQNADLKRVIEAIGEREPDLLERAPGDGKPVGIEGWRV